jgi:hypothetical protein
LSIKKVILLPDFHHPHHNKVAINAVFEFIEYFKPDAINILGDALNMDSINHWEMAKGNKKYFEGKRLLEEYTSFDRDILTPLEKLVGKECEKTFMGGNHEFWVDGLTDRVPSLLGIVELETALKLKERGWEWIPWITYDEVKGSYTRGVKQYGKLLAFHGQYFNKYHAHKTADSYSKSCVYAHTHDLQLYTKISVDDAKDYHTAQSIGCLCNTSPEFLKGRVNRWVNAFGVLYIREDGMYNLYIPVIINGKFTFEGRIFG